MENKPAEELVISLVQTDIVWEAVEENLSKLSEKVSLLQNKTDIIVLPEMFATGFTMKPEQVCGFQDRIIDWLSAMSEKLNSAMLASFAAKDGEGGTVAYYNRLAWVSPNGGVEFYDKRHLFRMAGEDKQYRKGEAKLIVDYKGWKIRPFVCYDVRFPVWARNVVVENEKPAYEYDCAIYIANWPASRAYQWESLLCARAIENQAFTVGVNRVGVDDKGYKYSGNSVVFDLKGKDVAGIKPDEEVIKTVFLSRADLDKFRSRFPFVLDADEFEIKL